MISIEGHGDDVICVEGTVREEFTYHNPGGSGDLILFSDGTLLRVMFDPDGTGNWRITPVQVGTAGLHIEQTTGEEGTDVATLTGPVRWVARGDVYHLTTEPALPRSWADLFAALTLLASGQSDTISPLHCESGQLTVMADPDKFTADELAVLDKLGFTATAGAPTFTSTRFGAA